MSTNCEVLTRIRLLLHRFYSQTIFGKSAYSEHVDPNASHLWGPNAKLVVNLINPNQQTSNSIGFQLTAGIRSAQKRYLRHSSSSNMAHANFSTPLFCDKFNPSDPRHLCSQRHEILRNCWPLPVLHLFRLSSSWTRNSTYSVSATKRKTNFFFKVSAIV